MNNQGVANGSAAEALESLPPHTTDLVDVTVGTDPEPQVRPGSPPLRDVHFRPTFYTESLKSAIDRALALAAVAVFALPMLVIALVIAMTMGRPVLFRQRRIGRGGEAFEMLKFRTMGPDRRADGLSVIRDRRLTHKSDADPRHTRVGRFLRRCSLDELPQLLNILRGDMSIVGPRPELESVVRDHYPPGLAQRHQVRPGLTGPWQISARGDGPMHENGEPDIDYVERISPLTDLVIVLRTPFALFGRNAGR